MHPDDFSDYITANYNVLTETGWSCSHDKHLKLHISLSNLFTATAVVVGGTGEAKGVKLKATKSQQACIWKKVE